MRLIIHPGWSKTGTSAIQSYFAANYDEYLNRGILYPLAGRFIDNAHHGLALAASPKPGITSNITLATAVSQICHEIKTTSPNCVVISSELSPVYFLYDDLLPLLRMFDVIQLVFTVRPQDDIIVSLYKQIIKDPSIYFSQSILDLFLENATWLNFEAEINRWIAADFDCNLSIKVVRYSPRTLINDFVVACNFSDVLPYHSRPNSSPSDLAIAVLAQTMDFRWNMHDLDKQQAFVDYVIQQTEGVELAGFPLSEPESMIVRSIYLSCNEAISKKYFDGLPLFPDQPQRKQNIDAEKSSIINAFSSLIVRGFKQ